MDSEKMIELKKRLFDVKMNIFMNKNNPEKVKELLQEQEQIRKELRHETYLNFQEERGKRK